MVTFTWPNGRQNAYVNEEYYGSIINNLRDLKINFFTATMDYRSTELRYHGYTIYLNTEPNDEVYSLITKAIEYQKEQEELAKLEHFVRKVPGNIYYLVINNR